MVLIQWCNIKTKYDIISKELKKIKEALAERLFAASRVKVIPDSTPTVLKKRLHLR